MKLSIVIPVYNEENTFLELLRWVREEKHEKEIIIVDDYSTDGTRDILKELEGEDDIRVFYQEKNKGKGAAIREGFKHVKGDIVIIQDADLEYYPDEYEQLIKPIVQGKADVVYGSRFLGAHRAHLFWHYMGNKTINLITNVVLNTCLTDMMTCYKAFRREALQSLVLKANRFGIEPEMTAEIFKRRYRVYEVPISYNARDYEEGKKIKWTDFFKCCCWLMRAYLRKNDVGHDTLLKMQVMKNNNDWVYSKLRPHLGESTLELGSGIGTFSLKLVRDTKNLIVSDIDKSHLLRLKQKFIGNKRVAIKEVDAAKVSDTIESVSVDTIVTLNMLEHVEDDQTALNGMKEVLKKDGKLLMIVPAHKWLYGSLDKEIHHYRRYSKKDLLKKLEKAGFLIEKIEYMNALSVWGWWFNFVLLKRKTMPLPTVALADKLIPFIKVAEKVIHLPLGLSLFVVARKK